MKSSPWFRLPFLMLSVGLLAGCGTPSAEQAENQSARAADILIERWINASGGAETLNGIESVVSLVSLDYGNGTPQVTARAWVLQSGEFRLEATMPSGTFIEAYDGQVAWRYHENFGFGFIPSQELAVALRRNDPCEPLNVRRNYPTRERLSDAEFGGQMRQVLRLVDRAGGVERWFFDQASGQRVGVYHDTPAQFAGIAFEYSDFREVDGFTLPWQFRQLRGQALMKGELKEVKLNSPLEKDRFTAPAQQVQDGRKIQQVLDRQVRALGGSAAFDKIKSRITRTTLEVTTAGIRTEMTVSQKLPDRILIEQDAPGMGRLLQGYDGETAWAYSDLQGYRKLEGAERIQLLSNLDLKSEIQLSDRCPFRKLVGAREVLGRKTTAVALAHMLGIAGTYYFDDESGRLVRVESTLIAGPDSTLPVTIDFADFREVDGATLPFLITTTNPAVRMVTTVQSIANNVPLDEAIFAPKTEPEAADAAGDK